MNETETVAEVIWERECGGRSRVIQSRKQGHSIGMHAVPETHLKNWFLKIFI